MDTPSMSTRLKRVYLQVRLFRLADLRPQFEYVGVDISVDDVRNFAQMFEPP